MPTETLPCAHRWRLGEQNGLAQVSGFCQKCGLTKNNFKASLDDFTGMTGNDMHFIFARKPDYSRWP